MDTFDESFKNKEHNVIYLSRIVFYQNTIIITCINQTERQPNQN